MTSNSSSSSDSDANPPAARKIREPLEAIAPPVTLGIALLVYFGWLRTYYYYEALGIHGGLLTLTNQDFALISISIIIDFLKWGLIALLAIVWTHCGLLWLLERKRRWRGMIAFIIFAIGVGLLWASYNWVKFNPVERNLVWTAGVGLTGYSLWLAGSLSVVRNSTETMARQATHLWPLFGILNRLFIAGLLTVGLFVAVAWYAQAEGQRIAQGIITCPAHLPSATVYSQGPLTIEKNGVTTTKISDEAQAYQYRYTGLGFLTHSNQKYFFIPEAMSSTVPSTIILPDNSTIRVELSPAFSSGTQCPPPTP